MKKYIITLIVIAALTLLGGCSSQAADSVKYESGKYVPLEYPANVFYYNYNGSDSDNFEEVDGIYPIESSQWDMIWNGGDMYCIKDQSSEANSYYANDDNYDWYVQIDTDDEVDLKPYFIEVTTAEAEAVYAVEDMEKDLAVFWEDFQQLGSIYKTSKDGLVRATISIGKYEDKWYWRSEVIDESQERDGTWPEYIQPLPESLSNKIK